MQQNGTGQDATPNRPAAADPYGGAEAGTVSMGVYVRTIWRRKWVVVALLVLATGLAATYTYFQPKIYKATALMTFTTRSAGAFQAPMGEAVTNNFVNTQRTLLDRLDFLREIANDPDVALAQQPEFRNEPEPALTLKQRLKISRLKGTDTISITMEGQDPVFVARTVNKIADWHRVRVETNRQLRTSAAVQDYTKKIADMRAELRRIDQEIWQRANGAALPGLTFGERQKDADGIVRAFQQRRDVLMAQKTMLVRDLDESEIELAAKRMAFQMLSDELTRHLSSPVPAPGSQARRPTATQAAALASAPASQPPSGSDDLEPIDVGRLAQLYQQRDQVDSEIATARQLAQGAQPANPYLVQLQQRRQQISTQIDRLRSQAGMQNTLRQQALGDQADLLKRLPELNRRMEGLQQSIDLRSQSLTEQGRASDSTLKALSQRKAAVEDQLTKEQQKLDRLRKMLPPLLDESRKFRELENAVGDVNRASLAHRFRRQRLDAVQITLDEVDLPLSDLLNGQARAQKLDDSLMRMEQWVREVKLALDQINVTVYEALPSKTPVRSSWPVNIAFGVVMGLMAGVGLTLLLEFTRKTVRTTTDVTQELAASPLGIVPHFKVLNVGRKGVLSPQAGEDPAVAEAFNDIRFSIQDAANGFPAKCILVTSATAGEGKSTVATMLAHSFARSGQRVLLIDGNVRNPYLHAVFGLPLTPGIVETLRGTVGAEPAVSDTQLPGLTLMPAGESQEGGLAWADPAVFEQLIGDVAVAFDRVIVDTTSVIGVADVRAMACEQLSVVCVVQAGRRRRSLVSRAIHMLQGTRAELLGVIINDASYTRGDYYHFRHRLVDRNGAISRATAKPKGLQDRPDEPAPSPPPSQQTDLPDGHQEGDH